LLEAGGFKIVATRIIWCAAEKSSSRLVARRMNYLRLSSGRTRDWGLGLAIATTVGIIYLLLRPPLYDNDGYRDRLQALSAAWFWPNPHHLLWNFLQAFFGGLAGRVGHPTTVSFQIAGIFFTCLTLLFVFVLLRRAGGSGIFSAAAVVFVAFSPQFWRLGLQNRVYPLLFLAYVLYLLAWQTSDGKPPLGLRLIAAGVLGTLAVLLHQAAILVIAAGVVVLVARNRQSRNSGTLRGLAWGASIALSVLLLYLAAWELIVSGAYGFFQWTTEYAQRIHRPNLFDIGFGMLLVKTIIAICGNVLEPNAVRAFMSAHFSRSSIIAIYALLGAAVCGGVGLAAWRYRLGASTPELLRTDACFAISMLSVLLWGAFMLAWEASPNYYTLLLIPGLLCLATLSKGRKTAFAGRALVAAAIILSVANGYLNHLQDLAASINFPPPLLDAIRQHVGRRGIFIVLEKSSGCNTQRLRVAGKRRSDLA
jgi:hypothetical protein